MKYGSTRVTARAFEIVAEAVFDMQETDWATSFRDYAIRCRATDHPAISLQYASKTLEWIERNGIRVSERVESALRDACRAARRDLE